ncbi:hypothetical protein GCM10009557_26240 [Virgisporangium ochraceum]|jgi:hypothetical protein|uniref:Uncharacterized protein n=2 Tax=Virgisporangium ochraceum TaxID=65505 RepID=A0A8J4A456_9ACTN|nr:hypothetical protein Voc01_103990 [Virgisporangium ochraceum]
MVSMNRQRIGAIVLLLIAFLALVASRAFPFLDDISGVAETAIALVGAACALLGTYLWLRKTPTAKP